MQPNDVPMYPDAAQRIFAIMKNNFTGIFNGKFLGLPDSFAPAQSAFPLFIVDKVSGTYKVGPTTADDITEVVVVYIMVDIKTGLNSPDDDNAVKRQLQTMVEGRDQTTGYLLPNSVLYQLRTNLTLQSAVAPGIVTINNDISISYASGHYEDLPETREATIQITVSERQMVPNRN